MWEHPNGAPSPKPTNWFYQLQNVKPEVVGNIRAAVKVVDWTSNGSDPWTKAHVDQMRGKGEKVIAYVSIGEAEDYRSYWLREWNWKKPAWLDAENPEWKGNYKVRYWDMDWNHILTVMFDEVLRSGFDGVYLDIIDAYEYWEAKGFQGASKAMIQLVCEIKRYCGSHSPDFWVVPQNGEGLLHNAEYRAAIDAIGIEDLFYGAEEDGVANDHEFTVSRIDDCTLLKNDGKPVLVVEYEPLPNTRTHVTEAIRACGFVPYLTTRPLNKPTEPLR